MIVRTFYTFVNGKSRGPYSLRAIQQLISSGQLKPDDQLRMDGYPKSRRVRDVEGLYATPSSRAGGPVAF